jgi:hypothetical protein
VILVKTIRELVDARSNLVESDGLLAPVALDHGESHAEPCSIVCDVGAEPRGLLFAQNFETCPDTTPDASRDEHGEKRQQKSGKRANLRFRTLSDSFWGDSAPTQSSVRIR